MKYSQVDRSLYSNNMANIDDLKFYFDNKFASLKRDMQSEVKKRKRDHDHEFKYKANKKQFEFNKNIKDDLEEVLKLIEEGSKKRSSKKIKGIMEDIDTRNKMIRIADKSPGGWGTVMEYESDSVASDSEDERKIRAAERRALQKQTKRKKSHQSTSTITRRVESELSQALI